MKITRKTDMNELLIVKPELAGLLFQAGMGCAGCPMSRGETLEQGCKVILVAASLDIIWLLVALRRHGWGLALIGSLGSIVCFPLSEVIAIMLISSSKRQFVRSGYKNNLNS